VAFDGTNIWVTNTGANVVTKLSASSGGILASYPVGNYPNGLAFDGANIWVANQEDNTVTDIPIH
jgi:DNA-binding beta-propeller fold protein YncE